MALNLEERLYVVKHQVKEEVFERAKADLPREFLHCGFICGVEPILLSYLVHCKCAFGAFNYLAQGCQILIQHVHVATDLESKSLAE